MPPQQSSDYRPLVGGRKWNEIIAELLRTEHEEKDRLIAQQIAITELFNRTDNAKTLRYLNELNIAATALIASKLRRIEMLYALLAMRERPAEE